MKRFLFFITLLLSAANSVFAVEVEINGLWYEIDSQTKDAKVIEYKNDVKYSGDIIIPESIAFEGTTYSVTSIGNSAFMDCTNLTSISIPESVTSFEKGIFYGCIGLTSITIPSGMNTIGPSSFMGCTGLTSITIPKSVKEIGVESFSGCISLQSMNVEDGNTVYDSRQNCNAIIETSSNTLNFGCKQSVIPNSVTSIGSHAFNGCANLSSINIPEGVICIGHSAFAFCSSLTSIIIPESVSTIEDDAFINCTNLTSINIPKDVTSIRNRVFAGCSSLTSITIPESVSTIESAAFSGCSSLTSITIPESVSTIESSAFSGCSSLTSITIPESVSTIRSYAFFECSSLTSITIPESASTIESGAFWRCSSLTSITIPKGVMEIGWCAFGDNNHLQEFTCLAPNVPITDATAFSQTPLNNIVLKVPAKSVGKYKVAKPWTSFKEIVGIETNDYTLTYIVDGEIYKEYTVEAGEQITPEAEPTKEGYTFSGWSDIPETMPANDVTVTGTFTRNDVNGSCGDNATFSYNSDTHTLTISGSGTMYDYMNIPNRPWESYKEEIEIIVIEDGITTIGEDAFWECTSLISVTIPNSVTSIGRWAFFSCSGLTSVTIPNSVTSIGDSAFSGCSSLTGVDFPNSLEYIGEAAFGSCSGLTTVNIPNSVTFIGASAFKACSNLTEITLSENISAINQSAFSGCSSLTSVTIPNSVTSIGVDAFYKCYGLTSVTIGNGVTSIGEGAFAYCKVLTAVTIPNSVTSIGNLAFSGCRGLTSITIPNNLTSIGEKTFSKCSGLTSVTIPNSVTSINDYAFNECSGLTSITIPNSVTSIGVSAFQGCSGLTSIIIGSGIKNIGQYAFADCTNLADVYCYAESVPFTSNIAFSNSNIENATLYVLESSIRAYQTQPWKNFKSIVKIVLPTHTLTYMVDGDVYKTYEIEEGATITPEAEPTKEGYTFSGWSEIPQTMPDRDVTITGTFSINKYTLTYMIDGEVYKTYEVEFGATITSEAEPTKEGYTFSGWSDIPQTMPANDVTVTGSFELTSGTFTLTYVVDGETFKIVSYDYGVTIEPEAEPTKEGYTFSGWSETPQTMPARDVTVSGYFSINTYTLTYMVDDEVYKTYEVEYGSTITPEVEPTKDDYIFSGWSDIPETMPAEDVIVTGYFMMKTYVLTYVVDDETYKTVTYEYGEAITPEAEPTKEGYTFSGWSEIPETMPAYDLTVTGSFTVNKYKLVYQVDGDVYKTYEVEYGAAITAENEPTKEGYTFSGWSEIPEKMPAEDVTVTGTFTINKYKLTYMVDGEEYKSYEIEYGTAITPEDELTKEGYTFSGWSEIPSTMPADDVTVTGTFTANKYKLTYMVDGEEYKTYQVEYGSSITPETDPMKEGYIFSGWDNIPETMPANDVTVSGTFTIGTYTLTYLVDGEEYKTISYEYGAAITAEAEPTKEGYTFSGWSEIPSTMPGNDVTVAGTFTINKYKLTYTVDGEVCKSYEVDYGSSITPEEEPSKDGYIFSGWSKIPSTMPAHDVEITGKFTPLINVVDDVTYEITGGGTVTVKGGNEKGEVIIEATVEINGQTYLVTAIASNAFKDNKDITSLTIADGITVIGDNAFEGCTGISVINIGKAVLIIGNKAFANVGTSSSEVRRRSGGGSLVVNCYAESVPFTASDAFENAPIATGKLLVNDNLVEEFKATAPWSNFGMIYGFNDPSAINAFTIDTENAHIYDIHGNRLDNVRKGVNIIRTRDGKTKKVMMK